MEKENVNGTEILYLQALRKHYCQGEGRRCAGGLLRRADERDHPNTTDAAVEKHLPVWSVENGIVHVVVSSVEHPMLPEHHIEWVSIHTRQGNQRKELHPGEKPEVCFALCEGDEVESVYAYCNLHGLWKA